MTIPVTRSRFSPRAACLVLVAAACLAYSNTFHVPFVFDDVAAVTQNPSLTSFAAALFPPVGLSVTGRPLANLSLALNHALSGENPWSYHALNLALHLANALLLFGLVRRTLSPAPFVPFVPFATVLFWAVHPLHTATVTYVMQRTELLASAAILLSLYGFVRSTASPAPRRWLALSVAAALAGMASKEIAVTLPLLVLLYDRTFLSPSVAAAIRSRPRYYATLAATWLLLALLVLGTDNRGASAGLAAALPWLDYARTQLWALTHYLSLTFWPTPLVFDYGTIQVRDLTSLALPAVVLLSLLSLLLRGPVVQFCTLAFLLLLAPTSLVPIATQTVAEHRFYLALVFPIIAIVLGLQRLLRHRTVFAVVPLAAALAATTFARNTDYRSAVALWSDTVAKLPANARAHYNLAVHLLADSPARDLARAADELTVTLRLEPTHSLAPAKLGATLLELGRFSEAIAPLESAVRLAPAAAHLHYQLAGALLASQRTADALPHLAATVRLDPAHAGARANYGRALAELGRYDEALAQFDAALRLDPADASARANAARLRDYLRNLPR